MSFGPNDRFQVVPVPSMAPGCCGVCKSSNRGPFLDTHVNDPWNGHVLYICFGCLRDIIANIEELATVVEVPVEVVDEEVFERAKSVIKDSIDGLLRTLVAGSIPAHDLDITGSVVSPGEGVAEDSVGTEGSSVSADSAAGQDGSVTERKRRNRVPGDSGDESRVSFGLDL